MLTKEDATCSLDAPSISPNTATLLSAFFTFSYVGSLYLARAGRLAFHAPSVDVPNGQERVREANERWRNDPEVIRARLTAAVISTVTSCVVVAMVLSQSGTCRTNGVSRPLSGVEEGSGSQVLTAVSHGRSRA